jgi:hypothetical protein
VPTPYFGCRYDLPTVTKLRNYKIPKLSFHSLLRSFVRSIAKASVKFKRTSFTFQAKEIKMTVLSKLLANRPIMRKEVPPIPPSIYFGGCAFGAGFCKFYSLTCINFVLHLCLFRCWSTPGYGRNVGSGFL